MRHSRSFLFTILLLAIMLFALPAYAHHGDLDASGGHIDKENESGLGSYHYHCGDHPAHLHPDGICPYNIKSTVQGAIKLPSLKDQAASSIIEVTPVPLIVTPSPLPVATATVAPIAESILGSLSTAKGTDLNATLRPANDTELIASSILDSFAQAQEGGSLQLTGYSNIKGINVRLLPSRGGEKIDTVYVTGTPVTILEIITNEEDELWYQIKLDNNELYEYGYVLGELIDLEE